MIEPNFSWNAEANGYISTAFTVEEQALVHIELASKAPVVTLKREEDGEYSNYGQSPKSAMKQEFTITSRKEITLKLASPVEVLKCYIVN